MEHVTWSIENDKNNKFKTNAKKIDLRRFELRQVFSANQFREKSMVVNPKC